MPAEHVVPANRHTPTFSRHHVPARRVQPGATVTIETTDAVYQRLAEGATVDDIGLDRFNLVTGPVYVEGASPGDVLRIEVLDIEIDRAWAVWIPGLGGLGHLTNRTHIRRIPREGDQLRLSEQVSVPLAPTIGCIGVAPSEGMASAVSPVRPTGGNMDLWELGTGTTLFLPVQVEGALFSVGDLHAAMGPSEPTSTALEAAGEVHVQVGIEPDVSLPAPRLRMDTRTLCLGLGDTHEAARQHAIDQAYEVCTERHGLSPFEAYAYTSARVGLRLGGPASPQVLADVPEPN